MPYIFEDDENQYSDKMIQPRMHMVFVIKMNRETVDSMHTRPSSTPILV